MKNTIEVRIFAGVIKEADLLKNVELLEAVYQYTTHYSIADMKDKNGFIKFVEQGGKRYTNLLPIIK